jgi:hypothetical protein
MYRLLLAVLIGGPLLIGAGCSRPTPPPPDTRPTAFFDWCTANKFGVKSPESTDFHNATKNVASGQIGVSELKAWTPCKSEAETQKLLEQLTADLRRVAIQHGMNVADAAGSPDANGYRTLFTYQAGPNHGTLEGKCALTDTKTDGKPVKAYFVYYKLTEVIEETL